MNTDDLNKFENFKSFRKRIVGSSRPNIRTARKKVRSGEWPGFCDGDEVYIYPLRFELKMREEPDEIEAAALDLLGI